MAALSRFSSQELRHEIEHPAGAKSRLDFLLHFCLPFYFGCFVLPTKIWKKIATNDDDDDDDDDDDNEDDDDDDHHHHHHAKSRNIP